MKTQELTNCVNDQISDLKTAVKNLPSGGGLEILKIDLKKIQMTINNMLKKINEIEFTVTGLDPNRF